MDQNISEYMIKLGIKKWWWPLFRFVVDVNVSNAFQIYRQSHFNPGEDRLDSLGFHQANVDAYYHLYRKGLPSTALSTGSCSLHYPENSLQFANINHWIPKGSQPRCSLSGCKGTQVYFSKNRNVGLHPECFELYFCKQSCV